MIRPFYDSARNSWARGVAVIKPGFVKLAHDPQMMEDARKSSMEIQYTSGKDILKVINSVFNQLKDVIAEFSSMFHSKGTHD